MEEPSLLTPGSVQSLMNSQDWPASNVFEAAPLIQLQSNVASSITDPSSTPTEESAGFDTYQSFKGTTTTNAVIKGLTRASSRLGEGTRSFGAVTGLVGSAISLPGGIADAATSIQQARRTGSRSDIAQASSDTTSAGSTAARLAKHSLETGQVVSRTVARRAGAKAFRQAVPGASKAVVKAAARQAGAEALKDGGAKVARRSVTSAATNAAKGGGSVARGAGTAGRTAAKKALREGGEAAAKAAGKAVAKGALKTGAKAAGRFVPGLNIAIAGLDTATAAATLADPKASTGKKVSSVITAAGSIVAATNIPVVSQVGAAVSTVSSFVGSFF